MCDYNSIFREIAQYKRIEEEAKNKREQLEAQIKDFMTAESITELIGTEHKALYREVVSNKFDTTGFKKAMPELAQKFIKTTSSMRFNFN